MECHQIFFIMWINFKTCEFLFYLTEWTQLQRHHRPKYCADFTFVQPRGFTDDQQDFFSVYRLKLILIFDSYLLFIISCLSHNLFLNRLYKILNWLRLYNTNLLISFGIFWIPAVYSTSVCIITFNWSDAIDYIRPDFPFRIAN